MFNPYQPPLFLSQGTAMTLYTALIAPKYWETTINVPEPPYKEHIFVGAQGIPIYGLMAIPESPRGTIVGTYGITGDLNNQWFLRLLGRKAYAQGWAVVIFDWRAHGKTALLSPCLTSDGLYEGEDFVKIALEAKTMGCPSPFWFTGYSLGGKLALWGGKMAQSLGVSEVEGVAVICPSLDADRSLSYLEKHPVGSLLEQSITKELKKLVMKIADAHPGFIDSLAMDKVTSIRSFDEHLVIPLLGFSTVKQYYEVTSPLSFLSQLTIPTLIIYAMDDPLFEPSIIPDLQKAARDNSAIDLLLTAHGGHVGYISSARGQHLSGDGDRWWACNRILDKISRCSYSHQPSA